MMPFDNARRRTAWAHPLVLLGGVALAWFLLLLGLDYHVSFREPSGFWEVLKRYSDSDVQGSLGNLPEVVVAVLGIATTVVSIVLQLSATRYTPRVTEMFFRDRTNLCVMGFFVIASVHCVWTTFTIRSSFIPHALVLSTMVMMTAALLIMVPYFSYVFAFLDPERIVMRLQAQCLSQATGRSPGRGRALSLEARQAGVLEGIEQLADVAVNSISQKDRIIASRSVDALKELVVGYSDHKSGLRPEWFVIGKVLRRNPDFVAMAPPSVDELSASKAWLEWKVLRQYQTIYNESLNRMRDINQLVAIDTRYVGETAIARKDVPLLELSIKFFNTYLRATINAHDVRTAYNVLHQYRLLGEALLAAGWTDSLVAVARHFRYYGQAGSSAGLAFINETAAYDLCTICEQAHLSRLENERALLDIFLEVDKPPENEAQELSLRGVRKAQLKLATFYLDQGAEELARCIWRDMEHERRERLLSIREEMLAVQDKDFWEVIDRGHNFDYLEPARRRQLETFFSWFPGFN